MDLQRRVSEKRTAEARLDSAKNNLMREVRMKSISMDPQYLKAIVPTSNLNYEVLRQAMVIALCAVYGASIFNGKTGPFG